MEWGRRGDVGLVDFGQKPRSYAIDLVIILVAEVHLDELGDGHLLQSAQEVVLIEAIQSFFEFNLDLFLGGGGVGLLLHYNLN